MPSLLEKLYNGTLTPYERTLVIEIIKDMIDSNERIIKILENKKTNKK